MKRTEQTTLSLIVLLLLLTSGCVTNPAPRGWQASAPEMKTNGFGGWVEVYVKPGKRKALQCEGELIAVHEDEILCYGETLQSVKREDVVEAKLMGYHSNSAQMAGLTVGGMLFSVSNGWFGIITMPTWLLGGSAATGLQSGYPLIRYKPNYRSKPTGRDRDGWEDLRLYARFPQGMHESVDGTALRRKPVDQ